MRIREWLFPDNYEDYTVWERVYLAKKKLKSKVKSKLGVKENQESDNLSSHLPSSISF